MADNEDENDEEENEEFHGFGNEKKKRSLRWKFFTDINIDGVRYAKCNLCVDTDL